VNIPHETVEFVGWYIVGLLIKVEKDWCDVWLPQVAMHCSCQRFYIVSQKKNISDVFSYNSRKHCRIFIIFGKNITKKAGN